MYTKVTQKIVAFLLVFVLFVISAPISEDIKNRTETSKEFILSNGMVMVQEYGFPVHYKEDNIYKEIDNSLIKKTDALTNQTYYQNSGNSFSVKISERLDNINNNIILEKDGYSISMGLRESNGRLTSAAKVSVKEGLAQE